MGLPPSTTDRVSIAKGVALAGFFGYAAGKSLIARPLAQLFPAHKTYVEPFCGSAALFFVKDASDTEVLSDADPEVIDAFRVAKSLTKADYLALEAKDWIGSRELYAKLRASEPTDKLDRLHKFLYLTRYAFGKNRKGGTFRTDSEGKNNAGVLKKVERSQPRLKNATLMAGDYEKAVRAYDSPSTLHFFDPPYPGSKSVGGVGEKAFDEARFRKVLESLKGKFLLTYGTTGNLDLSGFEVKRMRQERQIHRATASEIGNTLTHLVVTNFKLARKSLMDGLVLDEVTGDRVMVSVPEALESRGVVRMRKREDGHTVLDLVLPGNHGGWTFDVQRTPQAGELASVAKAFAPEGSRAFWPMTEGVNAAPLARVSGACVKVDAPQVEEGLQLDHYREFFLSKGDEINGALELTKDPDAPLGATYPWIATLVDRMPSARYSPSVLKANAPMPPDGQSALPASLMRHVPEGFRYWELRGAAALKARDALASSEWLAGKSLALVDGEFDRVEMSYALASPPAVPAEVDPMWPLSKAAALLPDGTVLQETFTTADVHDVAKGVCLFCDVDGDITTLVKALEASPADYFVSAIDGPTVRASLKALGRVFRFRPDAETGVEASKRLFVTSYPVRADVEWIDKLEDDENHRKPTVTTPMDDSPDLGKADLVSGGAGFLMPAQGDEKERRRKFVLAKASDGATVEDQIVYGIVLEPDEVDAQKDVYDAETVRAAAHLYMEEFQNTGFMHQKKINAKAKVVESYLAPCDFTLGNQKVKKGTWVMAMHILDPDLWQQCKRGDMTGFSIGGSAQRTPEPTAKAMRKMEFQGLPITIDRPKGYVQHGRDAQGKAWEREYKVDYGYIPRTKGGDGEGLDVFVGPDPDAPLAFWITQNKADGSFDEYKCVLGCANEDAAKALYLDHVPEQFFGSMSSMPIEQMKSLLNKEPTS